MLAARGCRFSQQFLSKTTRNTCVLRCIQGYYSRSLSTTSYDPVIREFARELCKKQPSFVVNPRNIAVLGEPKQFLDKLLGMIGRAKERIFISSLYIGSKETKLMSALQDALRREPQLQVFLQLDLNRSTRPGESSTARILLPLIREFPERIHVSLFRSPHLKGIMAKLVPPRFNEGWGTWHAKVYGVDNEVMISGANLNNSYFTNRQDRYLHFQDQPTFAQYCFDFLKLASTFSFRLLPSQEGSQTQSSKHTYHKEGYTVSWPDPVSHPHQIQAQVRNALSAFQETHLARTNTQVLQTSEENQSVVIYPIIQAGQFGIHEEETVFELLFKHLRSMAPKRPLLDLTSGYFSLYKPYQTLILSTSNVDCRIIAASPQANGFYGSAGISGLIPEGYTLYEQRFMKAVQSAKRLWTESPADGQGHGVSLVEWAKPGWTYHAKGIWLSPDASSHPILTLFGSTNLNARSAHLDTELSFLMIIPSGSTPPPPSTSGPDMGESPDSPVSELRARLAQEISHIRESAVPWQGAQRKVRSITRLLVRILKGML